MLQIAFQDGTLLVTPGEADLPAAAQLFCRYDDRVDAWRAEARHYAALVTALRDSNAPYTDTARRYSLLTLRPSLPRPPRPYQTAALQAWVDHSKRGVVVLPTGTGKTFVALLAIAQAGRSTLVVVPTLDLLEQWATLLHNFFQTEIGCIGGGSRDLRDFTVITYDSAVLQMADIGNRFGLLVVDECHHLPGAVYQQLARLALAPFRLGLTATPERTDGAESSLDELLGPICYRKEIVEMQGSVLADYRTVPCFIPLQPDEQAEYDRNRQLYTDFLRRHQVQPGSQQGWKQFLLACARQAGGREAMQAYLQQRRLARSGRGKTGKIWELLQEHRHERTLIFTADNATAYALGERFFLPVITHHTKVSERRTLLERFRAGTYPVLVTSQVLNEGVDVPEASIGIVVSGTGSVREHVQRLGRILRPAPGKKAVLYELISAGTAECHVSTRRRQHLAYEGFDSMPPAPPEALP